MSDRSAAVEAAILRLTADDMTADGKPKTDAINAHLGDEHEPVTAAERDAIWAEKVEDAKNAGPMDAGLNVAAADSDGGTADGEHTEAPTIETVNVLIVRAPSEPLPLYVHGVGRFALRPGRTYRLPVEALDALRNSDCEFTTPD